MTVMTFGARLNRTEMDSESGCIGESDKGILQNADYANIQQYNQLQSGASSNDLSETDPKSYQFSNYPPEEMTVQVNNAQILKEAQVKSKCCSIF